MINTCSVLSLHKALGPRSMTLKKQWHFYKTALNSLQHKKKSNKRSNFEDLCSFYYWCQKEKLNNLRNVVQGRVYRNENKMAFITSFRTWYLYLSCAIPGCIMPQAKDIECILPLEKYEHCAVIVFYGLRVAWTSCIFKTSTVI